MAFRSTAIERMLGTGKGSVLVWVCEEREVFRVQREKLKTES